MDADALVAMGNPYRDQHLAGLGGLGKEEWVGLLDRAAEAGLLSPAGGGYSGSTRPCPGSWPHPGRGLGPGRHAGGTGAIRAYAAAIAALGNYYHRRPTWKATTRW